MKIINAFDGKEVKVGGTFIDPTLGKMTLIEVNVSLFGGGTAIVRKTEPTTLDEARSREVRLAVRWVSLLPPRQKAVIPT